MLPTPEYNVTGDACWWCGVSVSWSGTGGPDRLGGDGSCPLDGEDVVMLSEILVLIMYATACLFSGG
jgi:hypothetical protein